MTEHIKYYDITIMLEKDNHPIILTIMQVPSTLKVYALDRAVKRAEQLLDIRIKNFDFTIDEVEPDHLPKELH